MWQCMQIYVNMYMYVAWSHSWWFMTPQSILRYVTVLILARNKCRLELYLWVNMCDIVTSIPLSLHHSSCTVCFDSLLCYLTITLFSFMQLLIHSLFIKILISLKCSCPLITARILPYHGDRKDEPESSPWGHSQLCWPTLWTHTYTVS